jgi:succinate dehydrogenase/fumarate reductase flavoprotein subunit
MRKKLVIAAATIVVGAGAAGAVVAFKAAPEDHAAKTCAEVLADPPDGGWTCYGPMPEVGK